MPLQTPPQKKRNIYMSKEALRLKNTKLRLWKRYLSTRTRYDSEFLQRVYFFLRILTRNLRLASYAKTNPKVFWKYAESKLKTRQTIQTLIRKDGSKSSTAQEKADTLNESFASVFTEEDTSNIPAPKNCRFNDSLTSF